MRLVIVFSFFIGLWIGLVGTAEAQSQWPASKVLFADSDTLQAKFDAGELGGVGVGTFASLPVDGSTAGIFVVIDCIDAACAAGGGSIWLTKQWNGSAWVNADGPGVTNLGTNVTASDLTVTSDTGSDAVLPAANATGPTAGVMAGSDKVKLDGIATGAEVDTTAATICATGEVLAGASDGCIAFGGPAVFAHLYSNVDQTFVADTPKAVVLNNHEAFQGLTHTPGASKVFVDAAGTLMINAQPQIDRITGGPSQSFKMHIRKNDVAIPNSGIEVDVSSTETLVAELSIPITFAAGDHFEVWIEVSDADVELAAFAGTPNIPSIIVSVGSVGTGGILADAAALSGSLDLGAGTIRGAVSVETFAVTGVEAACEGQWVLVTAAVTRTLCPVATSGQSLCYYTTGANILTIDPASSEVIVLAGAAQTGGVTIVSSGAAGEFVCLLSNGTNWYVLGLSGAWSTGS